MLRFQVFTSLRQEASPIEKERMSRANNTTKENRILFGSSGMQFKVAGNP